VLLFYKPAVPSESLFPLVQHTPTQIDLGGLTRGIDNIHIDVRLSPRFMTQVKRVLNSLLDQEIGRSRWAEKSSGPTRQQWEEFRASYARMVEATIHRAKVSGGIPLVQLVQFGAIKFVLGIVQAELDQIRQGLKSALTAGGTSDHERLDLTERLSWLARNRARLRYRLNRQLFEQLYKVEEGAAGELRQSLLGQRWSIPGEVLFNPLLQAESPLDDEIMMRHYVLLGQGMDDPYSFSVIDSALPYVFRRSKPLNDTEVGLVRAEQVQKQLVRDLKNLKAKGERILGGVGKGLDAQTADLEARLSKANTEIERARTDYLKEIYGWAEVPDNVDLLFNVKGCKERARKSKKDKDRRSAAKYSAQVQFQRRLLAVVERHFRATGLLRQVVAGYEVVPLYRDYAAVLSAQQLHQFLAGEGKRKEILLKIKEKPRAGGKMLPMEPLHAAATRVQRMSCRQEREYLVRFLRDFVTFRRDLSSYHLAHHAMNSIQLQEDEKNIRLSRTNRTLYEFLGSNEEGAAAQTVLNHVILKADVRGSTTMVAELRNRGLNPASHFSLNFFEPLNEVLETYGANKVFIEGDAVILSLLEHEEALEHRFSVARICGIAKRLLGMVQAQNATCRKDGLPELELGIGVVFSEEPPTFLYDGNTQIMISSAIGKADRLSSCSWLLRKERSKQANSYTNVDIYEIPEGDPLRGEKGEIHLRYNLNGVELDEAGFIKLQSEIALGRLELQLPGDDGPTTIYTGRYPDLKGAMHRVVVREGRIRLFDKQHPKFGKPTQHVFYEVVANQFVLERVNEAIKAEGSSEG
jgi:hypothetical protein